MKTIDLTTKALRAMTNADLIKIADLIRNWQNKIQGEISTRANTTTRSAHKMTIETVYVKIKSKKALNTKLAQGQALGAGIPIYGTHYTPWTEKRVALRDLPHGTVIKIYDKFVGGSPYVKAYGTWDAKKHCVR